MRLLARRYELQRQAVVPDDVWLTDTDERTLLAGLADVPALWEATPPEHRARFEELLLPGGYEFGKVRTAERGLLFQRSLALWRPGIQRGSHRHLKSEPAEKRDSKFLELIEVSRAAGVSHKQAA